MGEPEVEGRFSEKDGERDAERGDRGGHVGHGGGGRGNGGDDVGGGKAVVEGEEEWVPKTVEEIEEYKKREAARLKVTHAQRLTPKP